jgi:hypothetical protein
MKKFLHENWYKLMIGSSLFIFSVGFFINSISSVYAGNTEKTSMKSDKKNKPLTGNYQWFVGCGGKIYGGFKSYDGARIYWTVVGPE